MNHISKRLHQKLKEFSSIDNHINRTSQEKQKQLRQQKYNQIHQPINNQLIFPTDKETSYSYYNIIYSNFNELPSRNSKYIKQNMTTDLFDSTKTKTQTQPKAAQQQHQFIPVFEKGISSPTLNICNDNDYQYNQRQGHQYSPLKKKSKYYNKVGNRLYNYGYYIKNKIEYQKRVEEQEMYEKMKPKIIKSKIDWNTSSPSILNSSNKENRNKHQRVLSVGHESYTYKPSINPNSLSIANRLDPSYTRLTRKKKKFWNSKSLNKSNTSIELTYDWKYLSNSNNSNPKSKSPNKSPPKRIRELYREGLSQIKEKNETYEKNKKQKENEYKYYSFKPKIFPSTFGLGTNINCSQRSNDKSQKENYTEQLTWKKRIEKRNQSAREKKESELNTQCTFRPNIAPLTIENDEKIILRNICQMNDYVNKRRQIIHNKEIQEGYNQKRFGNNSGFQIKTTLPKEFAFKTRSRSKSNLRCYSIHSSNVFYNPAYSPKKVLYMRSNLGTEHFF